MRPDVTPASFAPANFVLLRFAAVRIALVRSTPVRFLPARLQPVRLAPGPGSGHVGAAPRWVVGARSELSSSTAARPPACRVRTRRGYGARSLGKSAVKIARNLCAE